MAVIVFVVNLAGLNKIVDIIGYLGPITILFTLIIAVYALIKKPLDLSDMDHINSLMAQLPRATSSSKAWPLAGVLYVAFNVTGSIPFLTEMGKSAPSKKETIFGAVIGGTALMVSGFLLNLALLSYADETVGLAIPNLYFAELLSPIFSFIFSLILLGEIFSTATPMLWVSATRIAPEGSKKYRLSLLVLSVLAFFGGQLPFATLVGTIYPYTGYLGIVVIVMILYKEYLSAKLKKM
ncbi:YkvI family membrane protein [Bavariicoccus seileri]|uniref:YkvI family membrane protein n=1 Tax=Bavariicoccus seileri TaxID=549685 RepID=UPI003F8EA71C